MSKKKFDVGQPCEHANTPETPGMVTQVIYQEGSNIIAQRQCSMCNQTLQVTHPVSKDFETKGIDKFYDWDAGKWKPVSGHEAYQEKLLAQTQEPPERSVRKRGKRKKAESTGE